MKHQDELETLILETLSLFDYYNLERIFIEFDEQDILQYPELTKPDLENSLADLVARKKLCRKKVNGEVFWKKTYPQRRSILSKVISRVLN